MTRRYFVLGALATVVAGGVYSWNLWRKFGALPEPTPISPNWEDGAFHNLPNTYVYAGLDKEPLETGGWLKFFLACDGDRYPPAPVPSAPADFHSLKDGEFVWLGHSSFLLKLNGKIICIDPVLSSRASPVPFTIPAWPGANPYQAADFPFIDYLCVSHDHWDHLDYKAVKNLDYGHVLCGKGVGAHFGAWGRKNFTELDWWEEWREGPLRIVFTPSQHFSGRGLTRNQSLWGGFVVDAGSGGKVYFTGDGGYGHHFAEIGRRYGPFESIFPDTGQYNRAWSTVHMFPEQAVRAAQDTRSLLACPAHIGKFTLAWHAWDEPTRRFSKKAEEVGQKYILPIIGEKFRIDDDK
ncbi:MAG: MBL fold metallo-hydrolase [Desulfovibrio sp.]|uniref:MBL fold metallo-hydrolase n=1 Tax=Desulfovibrio sp. TaxID=885 RepID=UPI001A78B6BB|nr:MBL fold metallo-hydrolase [Desulfovibrio sp.]MBD5418348.1 MBL fold metallo-hydrolase [Desulfovibrio sp.]